MHLQEISYSRVNHPDEVFNIGEKHDLKVISVDKEKLQVGCSVKQLSPDPFEHIENYELNKVYKGTVVKIVEFGAFVNILPGKDGLLHISEISNERTENVNDVLEEGQELEVKLIGFDRGKMKLSMKALIENTE